MINDMQRKGAKGKTGLREIQQTMMPNRQAMNKKSGFVDRARGTGRPTKKERRALDAFVEPVIFGIDDDFDELD